MYSRVLLALDNSHAALDAARRALALAGPGATYRLVHVLPVIPPPDVSLPAARAVMGNMQESTARATRERLLAIANELKISHPQLALPRGPVAREVGREAREFGADLVVLGARGETRLERMLGTTARHVLRAAPCDTLVARGPAWRLPVRALVCTDFYEPARLAAARALALAREKGAQLHVLHAIDPSIWETANRMTPPHELPDVGPTWYEEQYKRMTHEFNAKSLDGVATEIVEPGRPGHVAAEVARRLECDLILVGSHGPGILERAILGSEAERVVELAPCSVLVVRPER